MLVSFPWSKQISDLKNSNFTVACHGEERESIGVSTIRRGLTSYLNIFSIPECTNVIRSRSTAKLRQYCGVAGLACASDIEADNTSPALPSAKPITPACLAYTEHDTRTHEASSSSTDFPSMVVLLPIPTYSRNDSYSINALQRILLTLVHGLLAYKMVWTFTYATTSYSFQRHAKQISTNTNTRQHSPLFLFLFL